MRATRRSQKCNVLYRLIQGARESESGYSLLEVALVLPALVLLLVGAVDFGKGYYLAIEVAAAAESGALYGTQNWTDLTGMQSAAVLDAGDVPGIKATSSYGCECSDGTSAIVSCTSVPSCGVNVVNYVEVDTSVSYKPMLAYPGIPSVMTLRGTSRMRSGH